ncbi:Wzz/FepE/Etk N-terminal domain-containing protein [Fusobacterium sp.]|uniref:Wzz/FepE/Etk N-terminal domain-containing protein n=1 Tax=Fusobacterium sp. TaxID=68766 RepID=UPI0026269F37|nr:Wzz/FepE/Etk N-terminal domain-containing protein [Fusobacterium sp.]
MNLEKQNYVPENYKEIYEDEIDLKELFLVLWRNKTKIIVVAIICMVFGLITGKVMSSKSKKSTVVVEYTYPGIEVGKSPNGSTLGLTYSQFKNIFMIKDIFHKMPELEKNGLTEDNVLNAIKITPVLPKGLKEGEVYYPNKFTYSLKIANSSEKDEEVLKNFIEVQKDYFKRNYALTSRLPLLNYEESLTYDYKDIISVIDTSLHSSIVAIDNLDQNIISLEDKVEMQNILKELKILKDINLVKIKNMVEDYRVTKNPNELMINYRQQLEELGRQKEKELGKISQLESMIKAYKPDSKNVVVMNNGSLEKIKTDEENYYTDFLRQLAVEKIKLSDIQVEMKYIEKKMKQEVNADTSKEKEVDEGLEYIVSSLNKKIEKINDLTVKNYNKKYSDIIKVTETVTTKSDSKVPLMTLVGLLLGGFIGVCYVLVGNFIFEEKKKKNDNK